MYGAFARLSACLLIRVSRPFCAFLALLGALGFHCLAGHFCMIFGLGGTLKLSLLILGLRLGVLGVLVGVFLQLWGQTLDTFFDFPRQVSKNVQKRNQKGS